MLPSLAKRLVVLAGLGAGVAAAFLWGWGGRDVSQIWARGLGALAVAALVLARKMPAIMVDEAPIRASFGLQCLKRLNAFQNTGLAFIALAIGVCFLAAAFPQPAARRGLIIAGLALGATALALNAYVEWEYRRLIRRSSMKLGIDHSRG